MQVYIIVVTITVIRFLVVAVNVFPRLSVAQWMQINRMVSKASGLGDMRHRKPSALDQSFCKLRASLMATMLVRWCAIVIFAVRQWRFNARR